jgi:predicted phage replisome organizer
MAKTKVYFWLKIDKKFFDNIFIKRLKTQPSGYTMTVIYIRLMLESLDSDCILYYEGYFETLKEELALKLDVSEENIDMTLTYFTQCGLIQIDEEQNAELAQAKALIQQETNHASYMRSYRKEQQEKEKKLTMLSDNLTTLPDCKTEIEIEEDIDKELEINNNNYNKTVIGSSLYETLKNIGIHITDRQLEQLLDYVSLDGMSTDMLDYAIEITSTAPKPSFRYLNAILENWKKEGLTLLEQVKVEEHEDTEFPF